MPGLVAAKLGADVTLTDDAGRLEVLLLSLISFQLVFASLIFFMLLIRAKKKLMNNAKYTDLNFNFCTLIDEVGKLSLLY